MIGAAAFAVLLSTGVQIAGPLLIKYAIDEGLTKGQSGPLERASLAYLVLALAKPVLQRGVTLWSARAGEGFLADLRTRTYERLQELSLPFFEGQRAGVLVSRLTADVQSLTTFVRMVLVEIVGNLILFVVTLVVLVLLAPELLPFALVSLPLLLFAWWRYHRRSKPAYLRIRDSVANTLAALQERFTGVRVIQAFRREDDAYAGYRKSSDEQVRAWKSASYVNVGFWPLISLAQALALSSVLIGGSILYGRGTLTIGTVAAFVLYLNSLFEPIARLAEWFTEFRSGQAALAKIVGVLQTPVSVAEHMEPRSLPASGEHAARRRSRSHTPRGGRCWRTWTCRSVRGSGSRSSGRPAQGSRRSRSCSRGSTTPTRARWRSASRPARRGADVAAASGSCSSRRGANLFSGSIADNVRLARPEASDEEVERASPRSGASSASRALLTGSRRTCAPAVSASRQASGSSLRWRAC
jgi:ATP-binding cassette subfamily B protein